MKSFFKPLWLLLYLFVTTFSYADIHHEINNAHLLLYQGKYAQAEEAYTNLFVPAQNEFIVGSVLVDTLHINRAIARLIQNKIDAAKEDIEAAFHPQSSLMYDDSGYMLRALLHLMQKEKQDALEDYAQLIKNSEKGMANGYRFASAKAQRGWAHLVLGDASASKEDFLSAIATDTTMLGMDLNPLQKPFWQAIVAEVIPLVENKNTLAIQDTINAILEKQHIKEYPFSPSVDINKKNFANTILLYEIYGPAFLLREKAQNDKKQTYQKNTSILFSSAQQALLKGDKIGAFNTFVSAFKSTEKDDRVGRDRAVQGIASVVHSGLTPPPMHESARRLAIKAQVIAQEKAYQEAISIYWQAINEAPWIANFYYDHALLIAEVAQKNDDFNAAITEMKRFIMLSKNSTEIREAQDRIYQWEVKRDRMDAKMASNVPKAPYVARSATAGSSDCFIATAAFGSFLDEHVMSLRYFRDTYLLSNTLGQWFVEHYYRYSPAIADTIREHEVLRIIVRWALIPLVYVIEFPWLIFLGFASLLCIRSLRRWANM